MAQREVSENDKGFSADLRGGGGEAKILKAKAKY